MDNESRKESFENRVKDVLKDTAKLGKYSSLHFM